MPKPRGATLGRTDELCAGGPLGPTGKEGGLRVLLTGATGLIGRAVLGRPRRRGARGGGGCPQRRRRRPTAGGGRLRRARHRQAPPAPPTGCRISPASMRSSTVPACCRTARANSTAGVHSDGAAALFAACEQAGVRRVVQVSAIGVDRGAADRLRPHQACRRPGADGPQSRVGDPAPFGRRRAPGLWRQRAVPRPRRACPSCPDWRAPDPCRWCSSTTSCARSCSS